jgi:hypothetical protein
MAITKGMLSSLSGSELSMLMCLLSLTICRSRVAVMASLAELSEGLKDDGDVIICGTGLSRSTLKTVIGKLAREDLIHVYREENRGGHENSPRIFEINFTKLDRVVAIKMRSFWATPPGQNLTPPSYKYISDYRHSDSSTEVASYYSSPAVAVETQQGDTDVYVGKKATPVFASRPAGTAAAVAAAVIDKSRAKVSARAATATKTLPGGINRDGMQALFDKLYKQCGVQHRLMVTVKEFGYLRKSMQKNAPDDLEAMLRFSLTYWPMLSQQNSRAVSKDGDKLVKSKSLPPAPHFHTFAYWYPYFLRAYQNHLAGRNSETMKDEGDRKLAQLNSELERTRGQVTMLRRQNTALRATPPAPALKSISKPAVVRRRPSSVDSELPAWE